MIRLRPHHLLCMLTYIGKGYSAAFVANYDAVAARLSAGEGILLVAGPDDICAPLVGTGDAHCFDAHCFNDSVVARDALALASVAALLDRPLAVGDTLRLDTATLAAMRAAFAGGETRAACADCQWAGLCSRVADSAFEGARLQA